MSPTPPRNQPPNAPPASHAAPTASAQQADAVTTIAARLLHARSNGIALTFADVGDRPATVGDGYRLQDALHQGWGEAAAGWKIGATAVAIQAKFGLDAPFAGPFYDASSYKSPAMVPAKQLQHLKIESEFAFRFFRPMPPRDVPYTREEVMEAIDALVPTIEIVSPRFAEIPFGHGPLAIADWAANGAMVFGDPVLENWRDINLATHDVHLVVDDKEVAAGTGALVLGDPLNALDWAVEHLRRRGITLETGQIISTGTTTGIVDLQKGQRAIADFGKLGRVEMQFVDEDAV